MKDIFKDLKDETLPAIPVEDTDIHEECDDDNAWLQLLNDSLNDISLDALLQDESMDIDEDIGCGYPAIVDNVLNTM